MHYLEIQILLEGLFIGFLMILGFIGINQIDIKKKERKKYEIKQVDLMFGTSAYEIFFAINSIRKDIGLQPVLVDFTMNKIARDRCEEMIRDNKLSHELAANDFGTLLDLGLESVGENIAYGYFTTSVLIDAWMRSETHRRNMLNSNWNLIGISVVNDSKGRPYYCTIFGNDKEL